ncbi:MAG: glycosyltransferase [Candidatus Nitrospinota bacterium M3_3B_026]
MKPTAPPRRAAAPKISVIMGVYNGERHLREAVESVLGQTFGDFELIVIDDGSTDSTPRILASFDDPRLKIKRQENAGLTKTLNRALSMAKGEYVARQDADDVSAPERFEKQAAFLDANPDITLVGSWMTHIDEDGDVIGVTRLPSDPDRIAAALPISNQFCHGSIMARRSALESAGGYREAFTYAQDYDLVLRLSERSRLANIPEALYGHRLALDMISIKHRGRQSAFAQLAKKLWRQRREGGIDDLQKGAAIEEILPEEREPDRAGFYRDVVYLALRSGNMKKARMALREIIRLEPGNARARVHYFLTFLGPVTPLALGAWDALRYGGRP